MGVLLLSMFLKISLLIPGRSNGSISRAGVLAEIPVCTVRNFRFAPRMALATKPMEDATMNFTNTRSFHRITLFLLLLTAAVLQPLRLGAQEKAPQFRVIALAEHGGIHQPFVDAAKIWLEKLAKENNFTVDYIEDTATD